MDWGSVRADLDLATPSSANGLETVSEKSQRWDHRVLVFIQTVLVASPILMKGVLSLQPGPRLHPSLGFGIFIWSAQILQQISPWHNMLQVPRFNWHGLVPRIGLSAGRPA